VGLLAQSRGDGHRTLVTPEKVSEYDEDLIFLGGANEHLEGQTYTKYNKINNNSENFRGAILLPGGRRLSPHTIVQPVA